MKANQIPNDANKRHCLTRWQSQMAKQLQRVVENDKATERVNEDTAAARIPDHEVAERNTDGVSLATPASSPQDQNKFVKLTKTRENALTTTPQRTPCDKSSHGEDQRAAGITRGGGADEEKGRASVDRPSAWTDSPRRRDGALTAARSTASSQDDDGKGTKTRRTSVVTQKPQTASPVVDEKTGDAENPNAERAGPTRSADSSHEPPARPALEVPVERRVSEVSREVEDGPGKDGDEERRPRRPDEPPGEPQVESAGPTEVEVEPGGETGKVKHNRCAARESADAYVDGEVAWACRDAEVEVESVETRGNTSVEGARARTTAHARLTTADEENNQRNETDVDDVPEDPPDPSTPFPSPDETARPQNEPPSVELEGERRCIASCDVGLTSAKTDASGASDGVEDDGKRPMNLRKTLERVDEPSEHRNQENPPGRTQVDPSDPRAKADASAASWTVEDIEKRSKNLRKASERNRERSKPMEEENSPEAIQIKLDDPEAKADASTASWTVEDVRKRPKKLRKTSECVSERSEDGSEKNSPSRPGEEPEEPSGEAAVPGGVHGVQKRPRRVRNERVDGTNSPCRDRAPEGPRGEQEPPRAVEGDSDRANAVNGGGCDGERTRSQENERVVETNAQRRDNRPGGQLGERVGLGDVEGDRKRRSDGEGDEMDGIRGGMDGATSGARRDSQRVETTPLAEGETGQHGRRKRTTTDVPGLSTAPTDDHRLPTDHPNPPRRCGRLKTRPRSISTSQWTYQAIRTRRGRIWRIGATGHVACGQEMQGERSRGAIREDGDTRVD